MKRCQVYDVLPVGSRRKVTEEGFLLAPATLARTGTQPYRRGELGLAGDPNEIILLMRTADEVFHPDAVASFENKPVTIGHPADGVTPQNWRSMAMGEVRDCKRAADDTMIANVVIKDAEAIRLVVDEGKKALSNGYTFELDLTPGQGFDGYQRNIRGNHVAIVDVARGGPQCRIGDNQQERTMSKKITVDGVPMELDEIHAALVEKLVLARDTAVKKATDTETAFNALVEDGKKKAEGKKGGVKEEEGEKKEDEEDGEEEDGEDCWGKAKKDGFTFKDGAAFAASVAARQSVIEGSKVLAVDGKLEGETTTDLRRSAIRLACKDSKDRQGVVDAILGGVDLGKSKRRAVKSAFDALLALPRVNAQDVAMASHVRGDESKPAKLIGRDVFIARQAGRKVD